MSDRFWSKVAEPFDAHNDCWIWKGARNDKGYGVIRLKRPKLNLLAHRWAYEQFYGPIPEGAVIHHNCENHSCVNPSHLELWNRSAHAAHHTARWPIKEFCRHGHRYTSSNTYIRSNGRPRCRTCMQIYYANYRCEHPYSQLTEEQKNKIRQRSRVSAGRSYARRKQARVEAGLTTRGTVPKRRRI